MASRVELEQVAVSNLARPQRILGPLSFGDVDDNPDAPSSDRHEEHRSWRQHLRREQRDGAVRLSSITPNGLADQVTHGTRNTKTTVTRSEPLRSAVGASITHARMRGPCGEAPEGPRNSGAENKARIACGYGSVLDFTQTAGNV